LLVTDFIGTGKQASTYIEAAWRIWSVKSWCSRRQFRFEVVAYSGTEKGCSEVRHHAASPEVRIVTPCPTIETVFDPVRAKRIKDLCERHDPVSRDPIASLGYGGVGALLAFAHGCPKMRRVSSIASAAVGGSHCFQGGLRLLACARLQSTPRLVLKA
jgi:hypothetical protein